MTDEFQAAPPETDLRAMSDEDLLTSLISSMTASYLWGSQREQAESRARADSYHAELLCRLARPDALREKVMAALDGALSEDAIGDWLGEEQNFTDLRDRAKAAVAAVLEDA